MTLSAKHQRFCDEYIVDNNATQAAIRAGYSESSAKVTGFRLLTNANIQSYIRLKQCERAERLKLSADDVLIELSLLAKSRVTNYEIDENGKVVIAKGVDPECMAAVSSIKKRVRRDADGVTLIETEFKLWDKNSALEKLGKHLGLLTDRHELTGKDGAPLGADLTKLSYEQLDAIRRIISASADNPSDAG